MIQHKIYFTDATYNRMYEDGYLGNANIVFEKALNREEIFDIRIQKNFYIVDEDLKQRIDKAIEYIERVMAIIKEQPRTDVDDFWILEKLQIFLDILKGSDSNA